jgi:hypothetical protein
MLADFFLSATDWPKPSFLDYPALPNYQISKPMMLNAAVLSNITAPYLFRLTEELPPHVAETENLAKNEVLTARDLKNRGWTRTMVQKFLGTADGFVQNPHIRTGRPMRLFRSQRVHEVEIGEDFRACQNLSVARSARAIQYLTNKADGLIDLANAIEIEIPIFDLYYLTMQTEEQFGWAKTLQIQNVNEVAFLLGNAKKCEWDLDSYYWCSGIRAARVVLRRRMLIKIMEIYPHLSDSVMLISAGETGEAAVTY